MAAANCRMLHVPETRRYSLPYSSGDLPTCSRFTASPRKVSVVTAGPDMYLDGLLILFVAITVLVGSIHHLRIRRRDRLSGAALARAPLPHTVLDPGDASVITIKV